MKRLHMLFFRLLLACAIAFLTACGSSSQQTQTQPEKALDLRISGQMVVKIRPSGDRIVVLEERLHSIFAEGPNRTLAIVRDMQVAATYVPPAGWSLADFAVHPSGEITVVLTDARAVRLQRLDANAAPRNDQLLTDAAAPGDPYFNYTNSLRDDTALQPVLMHDAARVVPLNESVTLVLRTGRNAVVAYRFDPDTGGAYHNAWRTLVEPGSPVLAVGITSGSFDTFGQLQNHIQIFADADSASTIAVGVVEAELSNYTFRAHTDYFGETISPTVGGIVTRINGADGQRLGSTVVDTHQRAEIHGLRATSNGFALVGRVLTQVRPDGTGWDAFTALISPGGTLTAYKVVDVDRGDILFDITPLPGGGYLASGATAYTQNPTGESISESAEPLLVTLDADGALAKRQSAITGLRQNQITTTTAFDGGWCLGGMTNGPGTHSGDNDPSLIVADGFIRTAILQ